MTPVPQVQFASFLHPGPLFPKPEVWPVGVLPWMEDEVDVAFGFFVPVPSKINVSVLFCFVSSGQSDCESIKRA